MQLLWIIYINNLLNNKYRIRISKYGTFASGINLTYFKSIQIVNENQIRKKSKKIQNV